MNRNAPVTLAVCIVPILLMWMSPAAHAQRIPRLGDLKLPKPSEFREESSKLKKLFGAGTGCVVGGALGVAAFNAVDHKFLEEGHSAEDVEKMGVIAAGIGCVIGGSVALKVIENMDAKSKAKQEEAWAQALANGDNQPVRWEGPRDTGYSGSVSYENAEPLADGTQCITRKDYVTDGGEDATAYNRYCKNDQDDWELIATA